MHFRVIVGLFSGLFSGSLLPDATDPTLCSTQFPHDSTIGPPTNASLAPSTSFSGRKTKTARSQANRDKFYGKLRQFADLWTVRILDAYVG
jgi:hypothetical protein